MNTVLLNRNDIEKLLTMEDCMDASQLWRITVELVRRGYEEDQIQKIWGGNIMRIMSETQRYAKELGG